MTSGKRRGGISGLGAALLLAAGTVTAAEAPPTVEIGTGGLSFAANPALVPERQDVLITPDRIRLTYAVRNGATTPLSITIAFTLPDLDAASLAADELALRSDSTDNFVRATTLVDGQPVTLQTEQRALALGLDVTATVLAARLPLFPFASDMTARLEMLDAAGRLDLLERGILRVEGGSLTPAWTLKTVAHWRQTFAAGQTLTLVHSYHPLVGVMPATGGAIGGLRKRICLSPAQETAISKLPREGTTGTPTLTTVGFLATPGADHVGPYHSYRLIIETADPATVVASCRDGLRRTGPMQFELNAADYVPDEDLQVLIAR
jgi:hypothetical protein